MKTFSIATRDLTGGLVGIILTGFDASGILVRRMNAAAVQPARLDGFLAEMRAGLAAKGLVEVTR